MRRFALTLLASLSIAALTACSGGNGGSVLGGNSSQPNALVFATGAGGQNGVFKVAASDTVVPLGTVTPITTSPLIVSVFGSKGNFAISQFDVSATWQVTYAPAPATFRQDSGANSQPLDINCPALAAPAAGAFANPNSALVVQAPGSTGWIPYAPGTFFQTIGVLPVAAAAPLAPPVAAASTAANGPGQANAIPGYCLIVVATANNGTKGSFITFVGN